MLSSFDGREWRPLPPRLSQRMPPSSGLVVSGTAVNYEVTLEPNNRPWLFVLDATPGTPRVPGFQPTMTPDLQWLADRPVTDIVRYAASSYPDFRYGPVSAKGNTLIGLQEYVDLPPGFNPRTLQLAADLRRDPRLATAGAATLAAAVLDRLRTGGYRYTLEPGVTGQHSADEFWFDRKEGFCEHIASSLCGADARTGRARTHRHRLPGRRTQRGRRFLGRAPERCPRLGRGLADRPGLGACGPDFGRGPVAHRLFAAAASADWRVCRRARAESVPTWWPGLRQGWEALNNSWNQWVLNYTQSKQLDLLKNLGFESPSWEDLSYLLIGIVVFVSLCGAAWTLWERTQHDPWLRLLARARRKLVAAGIQVPPQAPPRELARQIKLHYEGAETARGQALHDWLLHLEHLRYAPAAPAKLGARARLATLRREFNQLAWPDR